LSCRFGARVHTKETAVPDDGAAEWCVQTRRGPGDRPTEHWVAAVEQFLATQSEPGQVRFTHGRSEYIGRFRDLDSVATSDVTGIRFTEFGWRAPDIVSSA
jgi:hypothetical protein